MGLRGAVSPGGVGGAVSPEGGGCGGRGSWGLSVWGRGSILGVTGAGGGTAAAAQWREGAWPGSVSGRGLGAWLRVLGAVLRVGAWLSVLGAGLRALPADPVAAPGVGRRVCVCFWGAVGAGGGLLTLPDIALPGQHGGGPGGVPPDTEPAFLVRGRRGEQRVETVNTNIN